LLSNTQRQHEGGRTGRGCPVLTSALTSRRRRGARSPVLLARRYSCQGHLAAPPSWLLRGGCLQRAAAHAAAMQAKQVAELDLAQQARLACSLRPRPRLTARGYAEHCGAPGHERQRACGGGVRRPHPGARQRGHVHDDGAGARARAREGEVSPLRLTRPAQNVHTTLRAAVARHTQPQPFSRTASLVRRLCALLVWTRLTRATG
jgi:hypothetical protein